MLPAEALEALTDVTRQLQGRLDLERVLGLLADTAARLLDAPRASVRLLDPTGTRLFAMCRAGAPLHENPHEVFHRGEGLMGWIIEHQRSICTDRGDADPRFAPRPGMDQGMGAYLGVPLVVGRVSLGVLSAVHSGEQTFSSTDEAMLTLLSAIAAPHVEMARLSRLATVDPLTGALNRRALDDNLRLTRDAPIAVVLFDADHFKEVNDTYGHATGDAVLKTLAQTLQALIRKGEAVVRWGGEEFLLILPDATLSEAQRVAERARERFAAAPFEAGGTRFRVTLSGGIAVHRPGESLEALIARADQALYAAKDMGRNCIEIDKLDA